MHRLRSWLDTRAIAGPNAVLLVIRFTKGLGAITNLSQDYPWGFWIGFDVVTGVAFAGGAYIITFVVYIMKGAFNRKNACEGCHIEPQYAFLQISRYNKRREQPTPWSFSSSF